MSREAQPAFDEDVDLQALQRVDPRLVALALGRIDEDELDDLMQRAVREPEIRRAVEAFWPLDAESHRRSLARAQHALTAQPAIAQRPHWSLMFLPTGVMACVVGVVMMMVVGALQPAPLPAYALEVRGGLRALRSDRQDLVVGRLAPKAPIDLVFRPKEPVKGPAAAAIFHVDAQEMVRLKAEPEVSDSGSARWRGTINSLLPGRLGAVELIIAIRAGRQPPTVADIHRALLQPTEALRIAKTTLVIDEL